LSAPFPIGRPGQFKQFENYCRDRFEQAVLRATARAARAALVQVRAGLPGRLKGAIGTGSELDKRGRALRRGDQLSASGWIHVRSRSERAIGALRSATEGGTITARRGQWLAIATDNIPSRAGRKRMTPQLYKALGLEQSIGPLRFVEGRGGNEALLVVDGPLSVDRFGRKGRSARRLPRRGALGSTRKVVKQIVAFVLIRSTSRAKLVDVPSIVAAHAARLPGLIAEEIAKEI